MTTHDLQLYLPRPPLWWRLSKGVLRTLAVLVIGVPLAAGAAAFVSLRLLLTGSLPGTIPVGRPPVRSQPSVVYDASGRELATFREFELSVDVRPEDIPPVVKQAVVAAEDQRFWEHEGVDLFGVLRAAGVNLAEGAVRQGGSTITQQLVKKRYLSEERTIERKLREAILATRLEREKGKEQILFEYLDTVYFGGGAYGIGAAAETYFRKHVSRLDASEAATLAGLIRSPSELDPRVNPFGAEARRRQVLRAMYDLGYLTKRELDAELAKMLWSSELGKPNRPATVYYPPPRSTFGREPYLVDYVRRYLIERYGEDVVFRGGLRVETTLDPRLQEAAEAAVAEELAGTTPPLEMSLVVVEPRTGHVKALVGGRDYSASQVNLALGGSLGMQPGSAFKPFTLAAALMQGYTPDRVYPAPAVWRVPGCQARRGCTVSNYSGAGYGAMTIEEATWASVNTVYAQLVADVGTAEVARLAHAMGVSRIDPNRRYGVSLTLGAAEVSPLDMAAGYAVFANRGVRVPVTPVLRVVDSGGRVLEDNTRPVGERIMPTAVADHVTEILRGVIEKGTGRRAAIGRPAAGKTGTAQEYRAAWFVGYTPQLAAAVWMGYADEPRPLRGIRGFSAVTGGTIPARAWSSFMRAALDGVPVVDFPTPGPLPPPAGNVKVRRGSRMVPFVVPLDCGDLCSGAGGEPADGGATDTEPTTPLAGEESPVATVATPDAEGTDEDDRGGVEGSPTSTVSTRPRRRAG
ncbi:MAG: penicillin-binding protein [Acidimicrobiales bacterium]|nr:MAG: penicillin-binding protein [Acidimicrobiales bacterium]